MSIQPYFYDLEEPFRLMEQQFFRPGVLSSPFRWALRDFASSFKPWTNAMPWDEITKSIDLSKEMSRLSVKDAGSVEDDEKFQVSVDVQHFSPEEISVKVAEGQVVVEGNHEEKLDQHGYVSRRFVRRYQLPKGCLPDAVESKLSSDGVLTVSAPKVLPLPSVGERIIPIKHTGPVQKQLSSPEPQPDKMDEGAVGDN